MKKMIPLMLILALMMVVTACAGEAIVAPDIEAIELTPETSEDSPDPQHSIQAELETADPVELTQETPEGTDDPEPMSRDDSAPNIDSVEPAFEQEPDETEGAIAAPDTRKEPDSVEPTPKKEQDEPDDAVPALNKPENPESAEPSRKPVMSSAGPAETPSATLIINLPAAAPSVQPEKSDEPAPTEKPAVTPEPVQPTPVPTPQPAPSSTPEPAPVPEPEQPEEPKADYTDATGLRSAFMDAINTEKAANGAPTGSLSSGLNSIAQDRARQMAAACSASHLGSGYPETVGAMSSKGGATNRGRNSVHHCPQLMDCTSFGIGVAIGSDGMYYYSIIGQ